MWQLQDHPGAPGTARQESTPTIVSTNDGGIATQPRAPGHGRPLTAQPAVRPDRPCAAPRGPVPDRSRLAQRAPDQHVPRATTARAPGADRPRAAPLAPGPRRPRHAQMAPGADVPLATTAGAPGPHRPCAGTAVPRATASLPAGRRWLRQVILPRVPATPNTLIAAYPHSRSIASAFPRQHESRLPPATPVGAQHVAPVPPLSGGTTRGAGRRPAQVGTAGATIPTSQVHPATQVPPCPRSCSTADTGCPHPHSARAPPSYTPTGANAFSLLHMWRGDPVGLLCVLMMPPLSTHVERGRG